MHFDSTHASLLSRVRDAGDQSAWREFDSRYGPIIVSYCLRRGLQLADAEDVRQVVMLALSRAMLRFQYDPARGRFRDYLGRTVGHAVSRHRKRGTAESLAATALEQFDPAAPSAAGPDAEWHRQWVVQHCRLAAEHLRATASARDAEIFDRLIAGQTPAQIGSTIGMTPEAVRKVKQRIRAALRAFIESRLRDEEPGHD